MSFIFNQNNLKINQLPVDFKGKLDFLSNGYDLDFVVKSENGAVYLNDIADIKFKDEERTTYAREFGENVVMLDIKKRSGKNMVEVTNKIFQKFNSII